jgi:hypothetical protein
MTTFDLTIATIVGGIGAWAWLVALSWLPAVVR